MLTFGTFGLQADEEVSCPDSQQKANPQTPPNRAESFKTARYQPPPAHRGGPRPA